jgi:enoyl-CoA hydratase
MPPEDTAPPPSLDMEVADRVMTLTLRSPPDNRITPEMIVCLDESLDEMQSESVDAVLVTGHGRAFSKGFDIDAVSDERDPRMLRAMLVQSNAVFSRLSRSPKPLIAAINGACLGGGLELALCCHFRLCAASSRLGLPEVWGGMVPGLGGLHRLSKLVGQAKALELVALGDLITSEEALRLNLANRVFPKDSFRERVASFVKALLTADPLVLREIIRLARCSGLGDDDCIREGMESFARLAPWMRV